MEPPDDRQRGSSGNAPVGSSARRRRSRAGQPPLFDDTLTDRIQQESRPKSAAAPGGTARRRAETPRPAVRAGVVLPRQARDTGVPPIAVSAAEADPSEHLPGDTYVDTEYATPLEPGMSLEEPRLGSSIPAWTPPLFEDVKIPADVELSGELFRR